MRVQAETAEGGLNENIGKTPKGVFPIFRSRAKRAGLRPPSLVSQKTGAMQSPPCWGGGRGRETFKLYERSEFLILRQCVSAQFF